MAEINCQQCRHKSEESPFSLSCAHKMCVDCLARSIISNNFVALKDKESLSISCKCKEGLVEISYNDYLNFLQKYLEQKPGPCKVHQVQGDIFCEECQMWLCSKCREDFHDKCYDYHHLLGGVARRERCKMHPSKETEIYCKSCLTEVCYQCISTGEKHFGHRFMKYDDYFKIIKGNSTNNKFQSFEDFDNFFRIINEKLIDAYKKDLHSMNSQLDSIIEKIKTCKENYNKKMESKFNRLGKVLQILRLAYQLYYCDLNKKDKNFAILKQLKKVNKELNDIKFVPYTSDELINIMYDINNFDKFSGFNYELIFRQNNKNATNSLSPNQETEENVMFKNNLGITNNQDEIQIDTRPVQQEKTVKNSSSNKKHQLKSRVIQKITANNEIRISEDVGELLSLIQLKNGLLVSSSTDTYIKFWDLKSKKEKMRYAGHSKTVNCLLELQENRLASGSDDEMIIIWNLTKNKQEFQLIGHSGEILSLAELPNKNVVSGSWDTTIKIWNLSKQQEEATLVGHKGAVCSICSLDNNLLASGSTDQTIKIWDCESYKEKTTLFGHTMTVFCLVLLHDGRLCSGSADKSIKVWDIKDEVCLFTLNGCANWIYSLTVISDHLIGSGSKDQMFRIWNINTKSLVYSSPKQVGFVNSIIRLSNKMIATGIVHEIKLWSIKE